VLELSITLESRSFSQFFGIKLLLNFFQNFFCAFVKAAPLSERQQMAIALAMSAQESGGSSPVHNPSPSTNAPDTTPRSAMLRKVNRRNEKGESPLHLATIRGDVDGMKKLLKAGAGVNVPDYAGRYKIIQIAGSA